MTLLLLGVCSQLLAGAPDDQMPADIRDLSNPQYLQQLAQVHLSYNSVERAEPLLRKALEGTKDARQKSRILASLGEALKRKRDWKSAEEVYQEAINSADISSERLRLSISLADVHVQANDPVKAEKVLNGILKDIKPGGNRTETGWLRRDAQRRLVQLWTQQPDRLDAVTKELEDAAAKDAKDESAWERLAEIYAAGSKRNPEKAVLACEKLLELRPNDVELQQQLAMLYQQTKQFDKAVELSRKMAAAAPPDQKGQYSYQLAQTLLRAGKKDEAVAFAKENLKSEAGSPGLFQLVSIYEQAGAHAEAEAVLTAAAQTAKEPKERADLLLQAADMMIRRQDYAKAEERISSVLREFKDNRDVRARANDVLVRLYQGQGRMGDIQITPLPGGE
jgi:tetratricopeptide (TPR) repeat protein